MVLTEKSMCMANLISYMAIGILESSWAPMVPYVKARFMLDENELGHLLLCMGLGAIISMPVMGMLSSRIGCRKLAQCSAAVMELALIGIALSSNVFVAAALLAVFGMAIIGLDISSSVNAVMVEEKVGKPLMSGFQGGYSVGTILGSGLMGALLGIGFSLPLGAITVCLLNFALMAYFCRALFDDIKSLESKKAGSEVRTDSKSAFKLVPPLVLIVGLLCFIMYGTEGAVMNWSAVFAHQERGISIENAGFLYAAFACTMTVMRLIGNRLVRFYGRKKVLCYGSVAVILGFLLVSLVPHILGTVAGFIIIGLGAANIVPQFISFAGTIKGVSVHVAITIVNAIGYLGILVSPVIIGYIANLTSIASALLCIAGAVTIVSVLCFTIIKDDKIPLKDRPAA